MKSTYRQSTYLYWQHSVAIRWHADCTQAVQFLDAYLQPYFAVQHHASNGASESGTRALSIDVMLGAPPDGRPDFTQASALVIDNSKGFLHCTGRVLQQGSATWVLMQPFDVLVRIDRQRGALSVWSTTAAALRVPLLRIIEDWVLQEVQRNGGVVLHASGVVVGSGAVLLVGNKGAGKTTGLCRMLAAYDAAKLANDNVCVAIEDGIPIARGWPAFFKVSVGTIATTPPLGRDFPPELRALIGDDAALWKVYDKVALYPQQSAQRFDTAIAPQAALACIVLPQFRQDAAPGIAPLVLDEPSETVALLRPFLQGIGNPNHCDWLGLNPVDEAAVLSHLRAIAERMRAVRTPIYRLTWAPALDELLLHVDALRAHSKSIRACTADRPRDDAWPALPALAAVTAHGSQPQPLQPEP